MSWNETMMQDVYRPDLRPPNLRWQRQIREIVEDTQSALWSADGELARALLHEYGLRDDIIKRAGLGVNLNEFWILRTKLGLPAIENKRDGGSIWFPEGIVVQFCFGDHLAKVEVWRENPKQVSWDAKHKLLVGSVEGPYMMGRLPEDKPIVLVLSVLEALKIEQVAGDLVTAVAIVSHEGMRHPLWAEKLAICSHVLVSFNRDKMGERDARYWTRALPSATRWPPYGGILEKLLKNEAMLRRWISDGLQLQGELFF